MKREIWIITGTRGAGKTTLCRRLVNAARQAGWQVSGLLSPALFEEGIKTGILVEDLRTGEQRRLASVNHGQTAQLATTGWVFDPANMAWGQTVFQSATPTDLLLVDELGPLEMVRGQGWTAALQALDVAQFELALVIIRPELLEKAQSRWQIARIITVDNVQQVESLSRELEIVAGWHITK
jgi:nucleoside-triphosphatase THEP1